MNGYYFVKPDGYSYLEVDMLLIIELAKTLPIFRTLEPDDKASINLIKKSKKSLYIAFKIALVKHVGLLVVNLQSSFYSYAANYETDVFPDHVAGILMGKSIIDRYLNGEQSKRYTIS